MLLLNFFLGHWMWMLLLIWRARGTGGKDLKPFFIFVTSTPAK
jgi:hypothetical protein